MNKRAFLIHGWEGYPEEGWRPWLRDKLAQESFEVAVPAMPDTTHPRMDAWLSHLSSIVGKPDAHCYFVGHSLGAITILRYLEQLPKDKKIGGAVFVAGFTDDLGYDELRKSKFFVGPIDWKKIKNHSKKYIALHSDNDPYVSLQYGDVFKKSLHAEILMMHNMKHFSGDDGVNELPEALDAALKLASK